MEISREQAIQLAKNVTEGPWYMHFWKPGEDNVLVVFRDMFFDISYSDTATWEEAIKHGKSINIPERQLDFLID